MGLWLLLTVLYAFDVIKASKNKTLRQRFEKIWLGTQLILAVPAYILLIIAIVTLLYFITNEIPLPLMAVRALGVFGLVTILLSGMLWMDYNRKLTKRIKED